MSVQSQAPADRQPIAELHRENPRVGWLHGLGAKGPVCAPWWADPRAAEIEAHKEAAAEAAE